jgi:uncharacterized membrane protein
MAVSWRQQTLIEAPLEEVWDLISDLARYPEWAEHAVEVTGAPKRIEKGSTYTQTTELPLGPVTTTYLVEVVDELRELKLRCADSGYYNRWVLTEARGATFTDIEVGLEPRGPLGEQAETVMTKGFLRGLVEQITDGVQRALSRP